MNLRPIFPLSVLCFSLSSFILSPLASAQNKVNLPQEPPIAQKAEIDSFDDSSTLIAQNLNCQNIGQFSSLLAGKLNRSNRVSIRISRRKRLEIHGIESLSLNGCQMVARIRVTLHRKIRRDAHGTLTLRGNVSLNGNQVCFNGVKVTQINLSRTLRLGESIYRLAANKALGNRICHRL